MIDGGKLYDWLEKQGIEILDWSGGSPAWVPREDFERVFRRYIVELAPASSTWAAASPSSGEAATVAELTGD